MECLKEGANSAVSADVYRDKKASLKQLAEDSLAGKFLDSASYFVSRTWLVSLSLSLLDPPLYIKKRKLGLGLISFM
jgi:hypothetical protein